MKKRVLSILLAMVLLLTCIPMGAVSVSAASSGTTGDCTWTLKNGHLTISGSGEMADYGGLWEDNPHPWPFEDVVKVTIGKNVTKIGDNAFYSCYNLTSVVIPDSVVYLGKGAFEWCESLISVTIGKGVKAIKESTFGGCCNLKTVTVGQNVTSIGDSAFGCCCTNLSSIVIPDGVTKIGNSAFADCDKLTSITIGKNIKTIGVGAFGWYEKPSRIDVYYKGSKADKKTITFKEYNTDFLNATWHYNACIGKTAHTYTVATCTKAKTCKDCGAISGKKLGHTYKKTVTKATATANGSVKYVCEKCKYVSSKSTTVYKASKVSLSKTTYTYNGKAQKPTVTVKDAKGKTIAKSNYTVTYASGRKNVGTYKVTVKFKGNYKGTKTLTFKIVPRAASVNKLTAKSKAIDVKLNRSLQQSTGYQIQYSTSSAFKTYKSAWITDCNKNTKTLSGLKAKTTYYVRVRTYKKVGDKFYYSNWSSAKKVKTK